MSESPADALPDHVAENRRLWDTASDDWVAIGERAWASEDPSWGIWSVPEGEVEMLPADMTGLDAIELGCGTGYVSAWMARRGATVTAIDNSEVQLATARRLAAEHGIEVSFLHGNAETVPRPDASYDFAINEYGAAIWCDPETWLTEAHRLLRPGGRLAFLANHPLAVACTPPSGADIGTELVRPYFGLHTLDWRTAEIDPGGVNFALTLSDWVALFHRIGFTIDDLREPRAPATADGVQFHTEATWSRNWPCEVVWKVSKR